MFAKPKKHHGPRTYLVAYDGNKKKPSKGMTVYGATPEQVIEKIGKLLGIPSDEVAPKAKGVASAA
jgi:hypothetical protein